jgi:hypothetical protein
MSYKESKMMLNKIRDDYGCKGEVIFRTALQYVVECGYHLLQDPLWVQKQINNINVNHDEAEKEGKVLFITRGFEEAIVECAAEIAKVPAMDMLQYVQKEVWLSGEDIDYQRAIELLKNCLEWFLDSNYYGEDAETLKRFRMLDLTDDEIEEFGYGWLFEEEEE